jgi:putative FmdB family regulatory protein
MPLYDFACDACDERFEAWAKPGEAAACPSCGSEETKRLFTPIAPPLKLGVRGRAARESDGRRAEREVKRKEAFREERRRKREQKPPPG